MTTNKKIITAIAVIICTPVFGWAINTVATGYKTTTSYQEIDAHSVCKNVKHTGSTAYFVPTNTSTEWAAFVSNNPSGTTVLTCATESHIGKSTSNSLSNSVAFTMSNISCGSGYVMSSFKVKSNVEGTTYPTKTFDSMSWGQVYYYRNDSNSSNSNMLQVLSGGGTSLAYIEGENSSVTKTVSNTSHDSITVKCSDYDSSGGECTIEVLLLCTIL